MHERTELAFQKPLQPSFSLSKRTYVKRANTGGASKRTSGSFCVLFGRDRNRKKTLCHPQHKFIASPNLRVVSDAESADSAKVSFLGRFPRVKFITALAIYYMLWSHHFAETCGLLQRMEGRAYFHFVWILMAYMNFCNFTEYLNVSILEFP